MIMNSKQGRRGRGAGLATGLLAVATLFAGCTDLEENPFSAITPGNFYNNEEEVRAGVAAVYNSLNSVSTGNYHYLNTISSDEQVIPTRGQDWYDNGAHLEAQYQTWSPTSPSGLGSVNSAWNTSYQGVARANLLLEAMEPLPIADKEQITAEVRVLRAWFYYTLMDLFGGVPLVTTTEIAATERATRAEVFAFIEQELTESRADLPVERPSADYGRVTQGAVDAILAALYLNAEVFTGTVTEAGLQRGQARWQDAYDAADRAINGPYSLATDWFSNFNAGNNTSPEIIFVSARVPEPGASLNFISDRLHYNQFSPAPNNGRAAEPPTYRKFDDADMRKQIFLAGEQVHLVDVEHAAVGRRQQPGLEADALAAQRGGQVERADQAVLGGAERQLGERCLTGEDRRETPGLAEGSPVLPLVDAVVRLGAPVAAEGHHVPVRAGGVTASPALSPCRSGGTSRRPPCPRCRRSPRAWPSRCPAPRRPAPGFPRASGGACCRSPGWP